MASSKKNHELGLELAVGAFVAAVFVGLAVFTIVISGKNLFRDNVFGIEVVLPDAMGLRPNDPVIAKGTTVGTVSKVFYDRDGVHVKAQLEAPVQFHAFLDLVSDGLQGVQAGHGVLEYHGDFLAPDGEPFFFGGIFRKVLAVVQDAAAVDPAVLIHEAHEGFGQHRFAAAAFAYDGQGFALV